MCQDWPRQLNIPYQIRCQGTRLLADRTARSLGELGKTAITRDFGLGGYLQEQGLVRQ